MFEKKKNIAEQMTAAYEKAHAQTDAGVKLLQLCMLEKKIGTLLVNGKKDINAGYFLKRGLPLGVAAGCALAGAGVMNPEGFGVAAEYMASGVVGAIVGAFGSLAGGVLLHERLQKKINDKSRFKYVTNIAPHLPTLKALSLQIDKDKADMVSGENAFALQQSSIFERVLKVYPSLADDFVEAQMKKPLPQIKPPSHDAKPDKKSFEL